MPESNVALCFTSAAELAAMMRRGEVSPIEVTEAVLTRIAKTNPAVNSYCLVAEEEARAQAREATARLSSDPSQVGPLHGVPVSVKDVTLTAGLRTTFGSRAYAEVVPDEDAVIVERLRRAGAIVVGKTTTPEFGCRTVTTSLLHGVTRNPWNLDHVVGGSSGGAAAAVAAGQAPLATGTDGAGSIRIPASCCGVVGLKPSTGRVPIYPRNGFDSLSHEGPLARTVADIGLMLDAISGPDERDPWSLEESTESFFHAATTPQIHGLSIAYATTLDGTPTTSAVRELVDRAASQFTELGAQVEPIETGWADSREAIGKICDVSFGLWAHDHAISRLKHADDLDPVLRAMMERGRQLNAFDYYRLAVDLRFELYQAVTSLFEQFDFLLTPTLAIPPFAAAPDGVGPREIEGLTADPFLGWTHTYLFNLTGNPAISLPCGFTADGLPIGLQLVARRHRDADLLRAAAAYELAAPWTQFRPPVGSSNDSALDQPRAQSHDEKETYTHE